MGELTPGGVRFANLPGATIFRPYGAFRETKVEGRRKNVEMGKGQIPGTGILPGSMLALFQLKIKN